MSIKYAILGLLSWKPSTGYEMKKVFEESSIMYWSGNNNQIYKTLIQLQEDGLVSGEVQHQETAPSKKVYTISKDGLSELREWVMQPPEAPEFRKTFLIQLAWADQLSNDELNTLLLNYENEIRIQLLIHQEKGRRGPNAPNRSPRESFLWDRISENLISNLKNELAWIQGVRRDLFEKEMTEQKENLQYQVVEKAGKKYIEVISASAPLGREQDAVDLAALCGEHGTNLLMIRFHALDDGFFRYRTKIASSMLQKFTNYFVKAVVLLPEGIDGKAENKGLNLDIGKSELFRIMETRENAEAWLLQ